MGFIDLDFGQEYEFVVEFYYDLNDGNNISSMQTFSAGTFTTDELVTFELNEENDFITCLKNWK